ncbi:MAG TPA: tripartite tricarboxylate transporter substrate-binding protein [Burkholderiales bacterium]|nr:tripartite tricarboxylate transporter substrate-binding protein [Burkholderiales bacterium]
MNLYRTGAIASGLLALSSVIGTAHAASSAQERYPDKPIRFVLANAPASSADILVRILSDRLAEQMKQPVVVDTRPGGSGIIGTAIAKSAPADGYTLLQAGNVFTTITALRKDLPFNVDTDFIALTKIAWVANVLAVYGGLNVNSVPDLIRLAKAKPNTLNYGSAGIASPSHLSAALLDVLAGIRTVHIPYKGTAQALTDTMTGQLQFLITSPLVVAPHANSGRIRVIATTGPTRDRLFPNLPTVRESVPGYEMTQWWGVAVPANTPPRIVSKLHEEICKALQDPDTRSAMAKYGATADPQSMAEFAAFIKSERARVGDLIKRAGIAGTE